MTNSEYIIEMVDDMYWYFAWKQVQTFVVSHPKKPSQIIYLWIKDSYQIAFPNIRHFFDYMDVYGLGDHEELERYDYEDVFDNDCHQNPFRDFIISIVEGKYDEWLKTAYRGRYVLRNDEN